MRGTGTPSNRRRSSGSRSGSVGMPTPDHLSHSASSTPHSSSSTITSNKSTSYSTRIAARTLFAGAFSACFTPPRDENKSSTDFDDSDLYKFPSDASSGSIGKKHGRNHSIYASSDGTTPSREIRDGYFTMAQIYRATKKFSPSLKIGQGGFGIVYKAELEDGTIVAVKRAKKFTYDKHRGREFQREVQTLAQLEHRHLVKLYGFLEYEDEMILVVEYVTNGTLREHLDGARGNVLEFAARLDIAIDVAHAIAYLHNYTDHPIIHRDIKSSNILLTESLHAKVADFGFARMVSDSESADTHISTQVKGTAGYLDPEYLKTYQLTDKSDVYSFGVLLVELVTGRRPIEPKRELHERVTPRWAMEKFSKGDAALILDPKLMRSSVDNLTLEKILKLALQCLHPNRRRRPTMVNCAEILWSIRKDYRELASSDKSTLSSN